MKYNGKNDELKEEENAFVVAQFSMVSWTLWIVRLLFFSLETPLYLILLEFLSNSCLLFKVFKNSVNGKWKMSVYLSFRHSPFRASYSQHVMNTQLSRNTLEFSLHFTRERKDKFKTS